METIIRQTAKIKKLNMSHSSSKTVNIEALLKAIFSRIPSIYSAVIIVYSNQSHWKNFKTGLVLLLVELTICNCFFSLSETERARR